jgi:ATP-dependent RNA helicase MSS116
MDAPAVVALANKYAEHMGCPEPPGIEAKTVGKMGLKGVPGLNIVKGGGGGGGRPAPSQQKLPSMAGRAPARGSARNDNGPGRFDPDAFDRKFFGTPAPGKRTAGNQGGRGGGNGGRGRGGAGPNKKRSYENKE